MRKIVKQQKCIYAYFVLDPIIELVEMQSHDVLSVQLTPTDIGIINRIVL
jgi:hypothetical protein